MKLPSCLLAFFALTALAQEARQLWNTEFLKHRPAGKNAAPAAPVKYRPLSTNSKAGAAPAPGAGTMLGVTFWRMRAPTPSDGPLERLLVLEGGGQSREETPERVDAGTQLGNGDEIRLTVEVPVTGYLYVVDRERYSDGTMSDPYLIYPNWQTRQGDNAVAPGRLMEIPDRRDNPNVFKMRPSRPGQIAEVLSLLVSPEPISEIRITHEKLPPKIDGALYAAWEKKWAVKAERFDLEDGTGKSVTEKESKTGGDHTITLTQDDAPPQTLYRVATKPGSPVLLEIPLQLKK